MLHDKELAIISPFGLTNLGLQTLLCNYFAPKRTVLFTDIPEFLAGRPEGFDFYLLFGDTFLALPDFFLPRKSRCIVLSELEEPEAEGAFPLRLPLRRSETELIETLERIFRSADRPECGENAELSPREIEVLQLVAQGLLNKEIADQLHISINTVLTHRKNITAKLGIKTVSGLTFYAMMNGLLH